MFTLEDNHLEWALKHLRKYAHSDFYPRIFEFSAIAHNWQQVKAFVLSLDLDSYCPKSPVIDLVPKPNGTFRIAHQLEPVDSLIYTALVRELCETIEKYRTPESAGSACSYRIKPDLEGSFFARETGWDVFVAKTGELAKKYDAGYVIVADITDFYNQIYTHRIRGLIEEAGKGTLDEQARVTERFLLNLNKETSRGIPVGPAPSIILAELIMADIDNRILTYTNDFVRYVDDIRIFFASREEAVWVLHELTQHLYSYHRLVFSGEKTSIRPVGEAREEFLRNEEKEENAAIMARAEEKVNERLDDRLSYMTPYDSFDYDEEYEEILAEIMDTERFRILSDTYYELFKDALASPVDFVLIRHILRKAAKYRVRNLVPQVLDNFEVMLPVIREAVVYLNSVVNDKIVSTYRKKIDSIVSGYYMKMPFVNLWISHLLQNPRLSRTSPPVDYDRVQSTRGKALIALNRQDTTWVRGFRDKIDVLGPWDKRAVLYSSYVLPSDEMTHWVNAAAAGGDVVEKSISSYVISLKNTARTRTVPGKARSVRGQGNA